MIRSNGKLAVVMAGLIGLALSAVLPGCTSTAIAGSDNNAGTGEPVATTQEGTGSGAEMGSGTLPEEAQLALGIVKLETTDLAVTPTQAAQLLPLWQAYQSLSQSDTTASIELEAVVKQIRASLTADQQAAIAAMDLSFGDVRTVMDELGLASPDAGDQQRSGQSQQGPGGQFGGDGFPPPGEMPGGGFGGGQGQSLSPEMLATQQARRQAGESGGGFTLRLIDPLLTLLKDRAGS